MDITRLLVANRGEIALRIIRACREIGIETAAVYSDADANARHVRAADFAVRIGPAPASESYLSISAVIDAARALAQRIQRRAEHADERTRFEKLTEREQNVLKFVARGYSAPEIGEKLFISPKTVDTYKQRINEKLGLAHRSDYVDFALKIGLLAD